MKTITQWMNEIHKNNVEKGFWEDKETKNKGEILMLVVSELSEALEADRKGNHTNISDLIFAESCEDRSHITQEIFPERIKDTFEDEIADAVIRLFDLAAGFGIDLEGHIKLKIEYNKTRPYKHDKKY